MSFRVLANEWGSPFLHDGYISPPCVLIKYRHLYHFAVKCSNFDGTRAWVLLSFNWLRGILLFRGKFQILAAKETAYVRAQVLLLFHWLALAVNVPVLAVGYG